MANAISGLGLAPEAAMVTFPIELFLPGSDIAAVEARVGEFYDGLTAWAPRPGADAGAGASLLDVSADTAEDALVTANHRMLAEQWGDGLPLWPPTRRRVD